jgi:hypothetical protein
MIPQQTMMNDALSPRTSETRPLLDRLGRLAELHRCCILLIRRLARPTVGRPVRRGRASMECSAALRTEFLVGSSPDAPAQTALLHVKSNLGPLAPPLDYRIGEAGNFHWTGLSNLTPEDLLAARPTGAGLPKRKFAAQWLRDCLQPGSQTQGSIEVAAERDGVCIATLRRDKFDSALVVPKTENQVPGGGLCPLRRIRAFSLLVHTEQPLPTWLFLKKSRTSRRLTVQSRSENALVPAGQRGKMLK